MQWQRQAASKCLELGRIAKLGAGECSCSGRTATGFVHAWSPAQLQWVHLQSTSAIVTPVSTSAWQQLRALLQVYSQLSKARLSGLVVTTAAAGYVAASGEQIDWKGLGWTSLGTAACAAAANTLNQVYEVSNDSLMKRTMRRPLPSGKISKLHALAFAGVMGASGIGILAVKANNLTAGLGAANIALYAGIYTPLKVVSIANTWVGAVVGAVPPLMGWAAASGGLAPGAWLMAGLLYFWQLPHFMALAWMCREDYARGGYRMISLLDKTGRRTAACALRNCLYLLPLGLAACHVGLTTAPFAYESALVTGAMASTAAAFYQAPSNGAARTLFRGSLLHLPLLLGALILHRRPQGAEMKTELRSAMRLQRTEAGSDGSGGARWRDRAAHGMMVVPFPFLPVPVGLECPSRVACESEEDEEEAEAASAEGGVDVNAAGPPAGV